MGIYSARFGQATGCSGRTNTTKERLGKNIGVQLIRVLKVSGAAAEIDKAAELQKELAHSGTMQRKYISRGGWDH